MNRKHPFMLPLQGILSLSFALLPMREWNPSMMEIPSSQIRGKSEILGDGVRVLKIC